MNRVSMRGLPWRGVPLTGLPLEGVHLKGVHVKSVPLANAALLLLLGLCTPVFAQQLLQPAVAPVNQPVPAGSGRGPRLKQPEPAAPDAVRPTPGARQSSPAIDATGPANERPAAAIRNATTAPPSAWAPVLNTSGVPVDGYIQVAPNRVYDPVNNRYHWTVPVGQQQKIVH